MFRRLINLCWYHVARCMCRLFATLCFRLRAYGLQNVPKRGPFLLLSNHQSYLDPIFSACLLPMRMCFAARDTLFANALFGTLIRSVNAIPLKRGRSDIAAIKAIIERLNDGLPVCLYPEGTRTADGRINAIKPGVALLSRRAGVPVVPMIIDGAFEAWPRTRKLFRAGCRVVVCYGPPIPASTVRQMGDDEFARHLTDLMRNMQNQVRAQLGRSPIGYPAEADSASGGPA